MDLEYENTWDNWSKSGRDWFYQLKYLLNAEQSEN